EIFAFIKFSALADIVARTKALSSLKLITMNPCFCVPLRTGALVIGILEIVLYSLSALLYGFAVAGVAYIHGNNTKPVEAEMTEDQANDVNTSLHED
ncbi:unnamed protein product, partial [Allacma fusca]